MSRNSITSTRLCPLLDTSSASVRPGLLGLRAAAPNQATQEALALREDTANSPNAMGVGQWQQNQALVLSRAQDAGQR
jgi:hypothetical protein